MFQVRYDQPLHIHFIGIGGISMSGLAEILLDRGFTVSGSDMHESDLVAHLRSKGATIFVPQSRDNVIDGIEVVCYTAAIHEDNPEYIACKEKGLPMLSRAELLGELMGNYQEAINIAGTHGKTTTTSMISEILLHAEKDPTISLGGVLDDIGGNVRVGKQDYFVVEACEYTNSFLSFCPTVSVILNVEEDHLDFFKDIEDIRHSFRLFCERTKENGCIIMNQEINQYEELVGSSKAKVITFGFEESADYYAEDIHYDEQANATFTVYEKGNALGKVKLNVPGKHNVSNALASIAVGRYFELDFAIIQKGLAMFGGTHRRFEYKGKYHGFTIIDDYAHHPQEIEASISTAKNIPHKKLWVAFQSHTYTRTLALLDDFAKVLAEADAVIVSDIYAAREVNESGVSGKDIVDRILPINKEAYYIPTFEEIEEFCIEHLEEGDVLITMGAGDINLVGEHILQREC